MKEKPTVEEVRARARKMIQTWGAYLFMLGVFMIIVTMTVLAFSINLYVGFTCLGVYLTLTGIVFTTGKHE